MELTDFKDIVLPDAIEPREDSEANVFFLGARITRDGVDAQLLLTDMSSFG